MLAFLGEKLSRRKEVLLACGSFYSHVKRDDLGYPWEFQAREVAERFVDGAATREELDRVYADIERDLAADPYVTDFFHNTLGDRGWTAQNLLRLASGEINSVLELPADRFPHVRPFPQLYSKEEAALIRDVVGDPFRPPVQVAAEWLSWKDRTVANIARSIYEERSFDQLPVLADALVEAGCSDELILKHCWGTGPHIRGCWVIDRLLGNE